MSLVLHQWYTVEEAVAAAGDPASAELLCDGQFAVLPEVVLCFITLGDPAAPSCLLAPERVEWKPGRLDYDPCDPYPWLPTKVREVGEWKERKYHRYRNHHLLLRLPEETRLLYAGQAHLGSYGGPRQGGTPKDFEACFYLDQRVPKDAWLKFGGYAAWQVMVNHKEYRVAYGDTSTFERLLEELSKEEFAHLEMTRYEQDSLALHTNARVAWPMYQQPGDGEWLHLVNPQCEGDLQAAVLFRCDCGIELEAPAVQTLPREAALQVALEVFNTGKLPSGLTWEPE